MKFSSRSADTAVAGRSRLRRRLLTGLIAIGIAFPSAAHPYTLQQLLRLPLERLLQLELSSQRVSLNGGDCTATATCRVLAEDHHVG